MLPNQAIKGLDRRSWGTEPSHPENKSTCRYRASAIPPGINAPNNSLLTHESELPALDQVVTSQPIWIIVLMQSAGR
jgi:hypothetical protein